jgi:CRP-like cAMP-binding protein
MSIALNTARNANIAHNIGPVSLSVVSGQIAETSKPQDDDLRALQQIGTKVRFARNKTIFNEGDDAAYTYKIISGAVRLCKHTSNGRRQIADFLLAGDYFGFLELGTYSFTAEAVSDVVVMCYPQRQIEQLSNTMPSMSRRLLMLLSQRLLGMQDHLVMLGRQAAKERVASFLLLLAERSEAEEGEAFEVPMSRQDMADYLGLTIETVCRALSDLKRSHVIGIPNVHQIVIKDTEALEDAADCDD